MTISVRRSITLALLLAAASVLLLAAPRANAAWGELDTGFAAPAGYSQQFPPGGGYAFLDAVAIQPDGKIVVAGRGGLTFFTGTPMIQRYLPDGTLDGSFGDGGSVVVPAPAGGTGLKIDAIGLQPDGKIVGVADSALVGRVFRLTSTGVLDTTFASPNGYVALANETPSDVLVHSSGDIYVASSGNTGLPVLRRYTSAGTEIGTFRTTAASNLSGVPFATYVDIRLRQSGNAIIMATTSQPASDEIYFVAKLDTTGALDTSWGTNGKTTVSFSTSVEPHDLLVQPSGAVVIGGDTRVMGDSAWTLARLNSGGTLDPTFAGGGKQELSLTAGGDSLGGLASTPSGRLVAVGSTATPDDNNYIASARMMTADGNPEGGFGPGGMRYLPLNGSSSFYGAAVQGDGKVVAVGSQLTPNPGAVTLPLTARFRDETPPVLTAKISSPSKSKVTAKKLKKFGGTASASFDGVTKVELALRKVDSKLLKKKKRCLWLASSKAKFTKVKAVAKKCSAPKWLAATGTGNWGYKLRRKVPKGSYVLSVRATAGDGTVQPAPTTKKFKVT